MGSDGAGDGVVPAHAALCSRVRGAYGSRTSGQLGLVTTEGIDQVDARVAVRPVAVVAGDLVRTTSAIEIRTSPIGDLL